MLMTNLDCCVFVFSSPKSHLCLQEPNTPWSQHVALPKTCSMTRSEPARSLARIRRGHARVPAWRRPLAAIRKLVSKCSGEKGRKSRNAAGAEGRESITAAPRETAGLRRSVWQRSRHHKWKGNSGLNILSPTVGFPAPMDGAGLPLGWWGPDNPLVTDSSCSAAAAQGRAGSSQSEYSHPHRSHRFPPPHLHLHLHARTQQRALSRPKHPSPAQIWAFQHILVYHLLLSDAELSLP